MITRLPREPEGVESSQRAGCGDSGDAESELKSKRYTRCPDRAARSAKLPEYGQRDAEVLGIRRGKERTRVEKTLGQKRKDGPIGLLARRRTVQAYCANGTAESRSTNLLGSIRLPR